MHKYSHLDPFGERDYFVSKCKIEISQAGLWQANLPDDAAAFLQSAPFAGVEKFPCLWGIYWWHCQAVRRGLSRSAIRDAMKNIRGPGKPAMNEAFSLKIFKFFLTPAELLLQKTLNRERKKAGEGPIPFNLDLPKPELLWDYCCACKELVFDPEISEGPIKNKGRTLAEMSVKNAVTRRVPLPSRIKSYAARSGVQWNKAQVKKVSFFIEDIIEYSVRHIAGIYQLPPFVHKDIDPLTTAMESCQRQLFNNSHPSCMLQDSLAEELASLTWVLELHPPTNAIGDIS